MKVTFLKRILILALAVIMLLSVVSCKDKGSEDANGGNGESTSASDSASGSDSNTASDSSDDGSDSSEDTTEAPKNYIDIVKDNVCIPILYSASSNGDEIECAKYIAERLNRSVGIQAEYTYFISYNPDPIEIIVGNSADRDYPEVEQAVAMLGYGEGLAKMIGNKLVVVGSDGEALTKIVTEMIKKFINEYKDGTNISIPEDFECSVAANELIAQMPVLENYTPTIVDRNNECYSFEFGTKENTFNRYLTLLTKNGFELYASKDIEGNIYNTYVNEETGIVATSIYAKNYSKNCRLLVEALENTELPTKAEDNVYTAIPGLESTITQVGLWYANESTPLIDPPNSEGREFYNYFNGMSYVVRLADGSFIIVDGGHNNPVSVQNLYNILKEQAPDPNNIVIAAWFISHDHEDHTGIFNTFLGNYKDVITIERFIYNFPGKDLGNNSNVDRSLRTKIIKAHPGQEFNIRNAKITMLYTMDVYFKDSTVANWDTNNASIVWKMEMNGKTFLSMGDYSESGDTLLKLYSAETLHVDVLQLAHHGISGTSANVYTTINPDYAFWPVSNLQLDWNGLNGGPIDLTTGWHGTMNTPILNMDQSKVFIARDDVYVMTIGENGEISTEWYDDVSEYIGS